MYNVNKNLKGKYKIQRLLFFVIKEKKHQTNLFKKKLIQNITGDSDFISAMI